MLQVYTGWPIKEQTTDFRDNYNQTLTHLKIKFTS